MIVDIVIRKGEIAVGITPGLTLEACVGRIERQSNWATGWTDGAVNAPAAVAVPSYCGRLFRSGGEEGAPSMASEGVGPLIWSWLAKMPMSFSKPERG